jgi:hypothetical protein
LFAKIFVTDEAIEKIKQKFSCTDEAIKLVKFCAIKRHFCLYKHIFLAMRRHNLFRNLFFEAMQRYNIRRYKSFTNEATSSPVLYAFSPFFPILCFPPPPPPFCSRSPSILENVSITAILYCFVIDKRKKHL